MVQPRIFETTVHNYEVTLLSQIGNAASLDVDQFGEIRRGEEPGKLPVLNSDGQLRLYGPMLK